MLSVLQTKDVKTKDVNHLNIGKCVRYPFLAFVCLEVGRLAETVSVAERSRSSFALLISYV
jgi:hypothetical protein